MAANRQCSCVEEVTNVSTTDCLPLFYFSEIEQGYQSYQRVVLTTERRLQRVVYFCSIFQKSNKGTSPTGGSYLQQSGSYRGLSTSVQFCRNRTRGLVLPEDGTCTHNSDATTAGCLPLFYFAEIEQGY